MSWREDRGLTPPCDGPTVDQAAAMARLGSIETELNQVYQRAGRLMETIKRLEGERRRLLEVLTCSNPS